MKMNGKQIAVHIQQIMRDAEMTQQDLANWLGISQPAVSQYLAGRIPPPDVLFQLSKLGKCSMEWLLTGDANAAPLLAVQEPVPGYGREAALLALWRELPEALQNALLNLMRQMSRTNTGAPEEKS